MRVQGTKKSLTGTNSLTLVCGVRWEKLAITSRHGTGKWVSVTPATKGRTSPLAKPASPGCAMLYWTQIQPLRLIHSVAFSAKTAQQREVEFMSLSITQVRMSCL